MSGLMLPDSIPGKIISGWRSQLFHLATSGPQLAEIERVLSYPRIRKRLHWGHEQVSSFIEGLHVFAELVEPDTVNVTQLDDADRAILGTFTASKARWLVTGDNDLLVLSGRYSVITPARFLPKLSRR